MWSAAELFTSEGFADDAVIADDNDELSAKSGAEHGAVLFGKFAELQMNVALEEG